MEDTDDVKFVRYWVKSLGKDKVEFIQARYKEKAAVLKKPTLNKLLRFWYPDKLVELQNHFSSVYGESHMRYRNSVAAALKALFQVQPFLTCPQCDKQMLVIEPSKLNKKVMYCSDHCFRSSGINNTPEAKASRKETSLERWGYENAAQNPELKNKLRETNLLKYGVGYTFQSPKFREKARQTFRRKYGVDYAQQCPEIQIKTQRAGYERKTVILGDNEIVVQGAEEKVARNLYSKGFQVENAMISIPYIDPKTKRDKYYLPDLTATNQKNEIYLVEVKSTYTLKVDLDKNLAKFKAANAYCEEKGITFVLSLHIREDESFIPSLRSPDEQSVRKLLRKYASNILTHLTI